MNPRQQSAFESEMTLAKRAFAKGELDEAQRHLERAHVLGQLEVVPHVRSHFWMWKIELKRQRPVAAFGQIVRIFLGALGSAVKVVPVGNTGGSDISMFRSMPVEPELLSLIEGTGESR